MERSWLARFLDHQREIIEAAETPFSKLAIFILPVIAPAVPATLTGLHLYKLLVSIFEFQGADTVSRILSVTASLVLELLGYVGAVSFIQSIYKWIQNRDDAYLVPAVLNGFAYVFYLIFMWLINVQLGKYFGTPPIMNSIVGLLSFITVPSSLLAANHLSQKELDESTEKRRQEKREDRNWKWAVKNGYGNLPESSQTYQKVSSNLPDVEETFQKVSSNWRKVSSSLSDDLVTFIACNDPKDIVEKLQEFGIEITPRTASNWHSYAPNELIRRGLPYEV